MSFIPLEMTTDEANEIAAIMTSNIVTRVLSKIPPDTLKGMLEDSRKQELDEVTAALNKRNPKSIHELITYGSISLDVVQYIFDQATCLTADMPSQAVH